MKLEESIMKKGCKVFLGIGFLLVLVLPCPVMASDTHDVLPSPAGTMLGVLYYDHTSGNEKYTDSHKVSDSFNLRQNVGIFRLAYYFDVPGDKNGGCFNILQPFGDVMVDGAAVGNNNLSASGLGDTIVAMSLTRKQTPLTCFGLSLYVTTPTGGYDKGDSLNIGSNRWAFRPKLSFSRKLGDSPFSVEGYGYLEFYTKNNEYTSQSLTQEKDPVFEGDVHLVYDMDKTKYISLTYFYTAGGETEVEGIGQDDEKADHSVQFTFASFLTPKLHLLLKYKVPVKVENGTNGQTVGLRLAYLLSAPKAAKK